MVLLIGLGMPDFDQILFKVQVVPKNRQPPANAPRAGSNTKLKAPFTRYDVNFAVALPDIAMPLDANGTRRGRIEIMLIAFSPDGNILNIVRKRSDLTMDPKMYEATQQVGMQLHEEIDVPPGEFYLRAGIYDMNPGNCGTVGAALNGSSAKLSKSHSMERCAGGCVRIQSSSPHPRETRIFWNREGFSLQDRNA
jgi:hypothetical protein